MVLAASLVAIWIALGTNLVGMKIGKWTENIGGASAWLVTLLFVVLAAIGLDEARLGHADRHRAHAGTGTPSTSGRRSRTACPGWSWPG